MSSSKAPRSFLIISVPETRQQSAVPMLEHETRSLCRTSLFQVPMLKVGGLGENIELAEQLEKCDQQVEKAVKRIGKWLYDLIREDQRDVSLERALTVNSATMYDYVRNFEWNHARYPPKISTAELLQTITTETTDLVSKLQARTGEFTSVCQAITTENKKQT
jgi:V-ATPase subunit C